MSKIQTAISILKNNRADFLSAFFESLRHTRFLVLLSDRCFIKLLYWVYFKTPINLKDPKTFNEKLNWLKLYFRLPIMRKLVDKYEVKEYVSKKIGKEYIIPTLNVWYSFDAIDIKDLPNKFVLKGAHDSSSVVICKNKATFNLEHFRSRLESSLQSDLFNWGREWPYKDLPKRIIAEEMLEDPHGLMDYKFFCFNGYVRCFKIDFDRFSNHRANYYDRDANLLGIGEVVCPPDIREFKMPDNLGKMIQLSEKLAEGFPFVRVDFYNVNGKIYFGEMTFFPASGFGLFVNMKDDLLLGSWLKLPSQSIKNIQK